MPLETWFTLVGLGLGIAGAAVLASGLIISDEEAMRLGSSYWGGKKDGEPVKSPPTKDRIAKARRARIGLVLMIAGFALQGGGAVLE